MIQQQIQTDTICRCAICGRELRIHLATRLQQDWPRCHEQDMEIVSTQADISQSFDLAIHPIAKRVAEAMRARIKAPGEKAG